MDKEWMRGMLPEKPPAGYQDWILRDGQNDIDFDFMLYSAERVKVYPELKDCMEPKDYEPIKSIWQTRCTCTVCGEDFITSHIKNGFTMYSGPDGCLYPVDPFNYEPEAYADIEDMGYDEQFVELSDGDGITCPLCCANVEVLHRSKVRGGRTRQALGCAIQNIANYTAVIFWLTASRIDPDGYIDVETYPRDAYVIGEKGGLTRYRHTIGAAGIYTAEGRLEEWKLVQSLNKDSSTVPYHNWLSIITAWLALTFG